MAESPIQAMLMRVPFYIYTASRAAKAKTDTSEMSNMYTQL